jgi:hypothetical protein
LTSIGKVPTRYGGHAADEKARHRGTAARLPRWLCDQKIGHLIPPIPTTGGRLWAPLDHFNVILYPFVAARGRGGRRSDYLYIVVAYYRYERIIQDIAAFSEDILLTPAGGADRAQALRYLMANFLPDNTLAIAYASDKTP